MKNKVSANRRAAHASGDLKMRQTAIAIIT
jgi:hypothetical protein